MTMTGYVSAEALEPRLTVHILNNRGISVPIEVVIDTGFTGSMTLPPDVIRSLGLRRRVEDRRMALADGRVFSTLAYDATVIWCGNRKPAIVIGLDREPLIGISLLWNSDIAMAVRENGPVSITAPSEP